MHEDSRKLVLNLLDFHLGLETEVSNEEGILRLLDMYLHLALSDECVVGPLVTTITFQEIL